MFRLLQAAGTTAVTVLLCCGVAIAASVLTKADVAPYIKAHHLVDIGGRRLNLYCTGHGSPAIILDAGAGDTIFAWRKVQPVISRSTRVCSYDRAGLGFSDAGPVPRDASAAVKDLHALLRVARISPPYIFVGHSEAGFYEVLYANLYPKQVAGIVLVDPSFPNDEEQFDAASPTVARMDALTAPFYNLCYEGALHGKFALGSATYADCGFPLHWQERVTTQCEKNGLAGCELARVQAKQSLRPAFWLDSGSELTSEAQRNSEEVVRSQRRYGALPLIVLEAAFDGSDALPIPPREMRAIERVKEEGDARLAHLSTIGVCFIVHDTGHDIPTNRPSVVISAIAEVLDQARYNGAKERDRR